MMDVYNRDRSKTNKQKEWARCKITQINKVIMRVRRKN
jgi:hypothetical protein